MGSVVSALFDWRGSKSASPLRGQADFEPPLFVSVRHASFSVRAAGGRDPLSLRAFGSSRAAVPAPA